MRLLLLSCGVLLATGCQIELSGLPQVDGGMDGGPDRPTDTGPSDRMDAPTDAGPADGSVCEPRVETCNGMDDDCDDMVDEDIDLDTDINHCGACDNACPADPQGGRAQCLDGRCGLICDPGFEDCNGDLRDGCEANLGEATTCGACNVTCTVPRPLCEGDASDGFECVDACRDETELCGASCVDTRSDPSHCGECGDACPEGEHAGATCSSGRCGYDCDSGFDDCDGSGTPGCEQSLNEVAHCGRCANECSATNATAACEAMSCGIGVCDSGFEDCDSSLATGCETNLMSLSNCGGCGITCAVSNGSASCAAGMCEVDVCDPEFGDCNGSAADGCESNLQVDPMNCGGCGVACDAACEEGMCSGPVAEELCNGLDDNGDGVVDEGGVCPCTTEHFMGHAYLFCFGGGVGWTTARNSCQSLGYALVTVDSAAENTWLEATANGHSTADRYWIGYNDREREGSWSWTSGAPSTFDHWGPGEPNNVGGFGGEDCAEFAGPLGANWNDVRCWEGNFAICESP